MVSELLFLPRILQERTEGLLIVSRKLGCTSETHAPFTELPLRNLFPPQIDHSLMPRISADCFYQVVHRCLRSLQHLHEVPALIQQKSRNLMRAVVSPPRPEKLHQLLIANLAGG